MTESSKFAPSQLTMTDTSSEAGDIKIQNIEYRSWFPWFTATSAIALLLILFSLLNENPLQSILIQWFNQHTNWWLIVPPWLVIMIFELAYSRGLQKQGDRIIDLLQQQQQSLIRQKGKLQSNLNQSWSQTDKLKRYITDKLVEVLEFDEKFYHFKGIASEVRHNGVICYDRIRTALKQAIEQEKFLSLYEDGDANNSPLPANSDQTSTAVNERNVDYFQAHRDLDYLWDLLDLSTADNLAEHITNFLIEQEALAYQQSLSQRQISLNQASANSLPGFSRFSINESIIAALCRCTDDPELTELLRLSLINTSLLKSGQSLDFAGISGQLGEDQMVLGKINHLILVFENLVKNAQFFSGKVSPKQAEDKIYINSRHINNHLAISVTNRSQLITEEMKEKIFQIGFSTRRNKGSHGKGLGLYFVDQIIKGYSGHIEVTNRHNIAGHYELSYESDESSANVELKTALDENLIPVVCCPAENQDAANGRKSFKRDLNKLPNRISIKNLQTGIEQTLDKELIEMCLGVEPGDKQNLLIDETFADLPAWSLGIKSLKKGWQLVFKALDRQGVCFKLKIPTLQARMSGEDLDTLLASETNEKEWRHNPSKN